MKKVTCAMSTYNRCTQPDRFVDEAVESFLRQDYPNKELIVFNDCPGQTLKFDHPQVKVVNAPTRCWCLAEKRNRCTRLGTGELVMQWDDDDIYLPWAITSLAKTLGESPFVAVKGYYYSEKNKIKEKPNRIAGNCVMYTRAFFEELGGYRIPLCVGVDGDLLRRVGDKMRWVSDVEPFLIYRWGNGLHHVSGQSAKSDFDRSQWLAAGKVPVQKGEFAIRPTWMRDYVADARAFG